MATNDIFASEKLEPLPVLVLWDRLPLRRSGKPFSPTTLARWATGGCRGVKLEAVQVGVTLCSSREALLRFFDRLSAARLNTSANPAKPRKKGRSSK